MREMDFSGKQIGNYRIINEINGGGSGLVYRARHVILSERVVAIKLLHTYLGSTRERDQFLQEARFLEKLRHQHILPILDVGFTEGFPYLIAEYATNGSLKDRLRQQMGHPLPIEEALVLLTQIGQALEYAHQQKIIHRDLKPDNILFNVQHQALLADFGIAIVLATSSLKLIDTAGTPAYMAPEQFRGIVSKEGDQYALGCIAYELFTGRRPFVASDSVALGYLHTTEIPKPPTFYNPLLPSYIERALLQALAKQRADRHASVTAFVTALNRAETTKPMLVIPHDSEYWLNEGTTHYKCGRYSEALIYFEQALQCDPTNSAAYIGKGKSFHHLVRYQDALDAFTQVLRFDPNHAPAYDGKGNALLGLHRHEEAVVAFKEAVRLNPKNAVYQNKCGIALYNLKKYKEALFAYEEAVRLDPANAEYQNWRGVILSNLKRYEEAVGAFDAAVHLAPANAMYQNWRGSILYELKRYEEALLAYEEAVRLDPTNVVYRHNRGNTLSNLKKHEEVAAAYAVAAYEEAVRLDPTNAEYQNWRGAALCELKRYEEALCAYEEAVRLDPMNAEYQDKRGTTLYELRRYEEALFAYEEALFAYEEAVRLDPINVEYQNHRRKVLSLKSKNMKRWW